MENNYRRFLLSSLVFYLMFVIKFYISLPITSQTLKKNLCYDIDSNYCTYRRIKDVIFIFVYHTKCLLAYC